MRQFAVLFILYFLTSISATAKESILAEAREYSYTAQLPACADGGVTGLIAGRFEAREKEFWASNLSVNEILKIKETGFRPNGLDIIPRRYCSATIVLSDLKKRQIDYFITEDAGIIGWNYGVDWCVSGLDRSYAYDGQCRAARP